METKNEFVFYFVDVQTIENKEDNKKEIIQKTKQEDVDDGLNKFVYDIFWGCEKYDKNRKYYTINELQTNLIVNEVKVKWYKDFTEYIKKEEIELQSREVLLLYQVFVTRILYMIFINNRDNLSDYVKSNDLKLKFDVLCDEFVKSIPDFKTNQDMLNFLFGKMLDADKNKNDIDKMKQEILDCVKSLLENKNNGGEEDYNFKIDDENKLVKANSCFITSNKIETEKTKWQENLGKEIFLRQTEEIKTQKDVDYDTLEPINNLLKNNGDHLKAIYAMQWDGKKTQNKTPISYKTLLLYLDKTNKNADRNFEAIFNYYLDNMDGSEYLNPIIKVGIRSFKEIFMPNSVLKEYWTRKIVYKDKSKAYGQPKDNFDDLFKKLENERFRIGYPNLEIFKYKDEDGNLYTHRFVLEHLGNFCYKKQIVQDYQDGYKYTKVTHEITIKPEYKNDFKDIKIKPNTFSRESLIDYLKNGFIDADDDETCQKDILNEKYYQCLKLIPIEQLLKTKTCNDTPKKYLCDFNMLSDLDDKCENIEQMVKQIIKEAVIKDDTIKIDKKNELSSWNFDKLDEKEKDDYIYKNCSYHNVFTENNLFRVISEKLKNETVKIRHDNHEVIKAIFKIFKYNFRSYSGDYDGYHEINYFIDCCNLVKELCVKYESEKEFITYELFGIMLDFIDWFYDFDVGRYASILFQLDNLPDNKNYKFTTDQQIGLLRLCIDKLNNINDENRDKIRSTINSVFKAMTKQNETVPLDQKVIDYLFLKINDTYCLDKLISNISYKKYGFNLTQNVVEKIFDLFIKDENLEDDGKQYYLSNLVNYIILNDKINFISSDKKQPNLKENEIKNEKEEQKQIRLSFIKMYLEKIKGNKKLISNTTLNSIFKYFDDSPDIKKEIANKLIDYDFRFNLNDRWNILYDTKEEDKEELKQILSKNPEKEEIAIGCKAENEKSSAGEENDNDNNEKIDAVNNAGKENIVPLAEKDKSKITESRTYYQEGIPPAESAQKESFFNRSIYFLIALAAVIVILTFVFKEPLILFALLISVITLLYCCFKKRNKNNSQQEKPNLKINEKDEQTSLIGGTRNINLDEQNQDKKIILDRKWNNNLNKN